MELANQRERVSGKGWRSKETRLIELAHLDHWRSRQWGETVQIVKDGVLLVD